ncbi:MAG: hypothetical protein IT379_11810 [Deltaproteobacteria bacterium]|nr:hypothetical protein [Deltaproteobacteria bacterium]
MDDAERFGDVFRAHGGALDLTQLPPPMSIGLGEQLAFLRAAAPDVTSGFILNRAFNAVASLRDGREFLGIFVGAPLLLARFAYCFLSDPFTLTQIGDSSAESVRYDTIAALRQRKWPIEGPWEYLPRDTLRFHAAQQLCFCMNLVLFFHEIGHIELCHLEYLERETGVRDYVEMRASSASQEEALIVRTLEWDADHTALLSSLKAWKWFCRRYDYSAISALGVANAWWTAVQLLFWTMAFADPHDEGRPPTHPSPWTRIVNARMVAQSFGFVPELESQPVTGSADGVLDWLLRHRLYDVGMVTAAAGPKSVNAVVQELAEIGDCYRAIVDRLGRFQEAREKRTGRRIQRPPLGTPIA